MALQAWAAPRLSALLPLDTAELNQIITYTASLSDLEATKHLQDLLGDSAEAAKFILSFNEYRANLKSAQLDGSGGSNTPLPDYSSSTSKDSKPALQDSSLTSPSDPAQESKAKDVGNPKDHSPPDYAPPSYAPPAQSAHAHSHTNPLIEASHVRERDEQEMQQALQTLQYKYGIYNSDVEPEHDSDFPCNCPIHQYKMRKYYRLGVHKAWAKAVMYPGERYYHDCYITNFGVSGSPYQFNVPSPFGFGVNNAVWTSAMVMRPSPGYHARTIHAIIALNNSLNREAQARVDAEEPKQNIWDDGLDAALLAMTLGEKPNRSSDSGGGEASEKPKRSRLSMFRKTIGIKSSGQKAAESAQSLRDAILAEEQGRWPDKQWRDIVATYLDKIGMTRKVADLRSRYPIQYFHLLRAGYFEPIPVAWANKASNPLKFSIEAVGGWRGITPAWRGYEDTAEERLYWVLNHREGSVGMRMKPDQISELTMAQERMARAVEPPPLYFSADDVCHFQVHDHGYSKQVMPAPFHAYDRPKLDSDDTMILLDVSGSMDFDPRRPVYNQYTVTGWTVSTQPKNKDVAKAITRRFVDALSHFDHASNSYDLTTFASRAEYIGPVNHENFESTWSKVHFGGGTRVMAGWQLVKTLHFQKYPQSATYHPVYGWQAGPETPMLRLLLLLDGEAVDMDEFELDLLSLSWAHVTIFLIGVDGCPHHHRHANELQRISDVNHHVSFIDAQGNTPERFVTHELLKRHLGQDISMREFEELERLPEYSEV
ncbi:hypothetical protein BX600DRAFT_383246 [Xylariales sp. PMI_506]|nr:hypothetical protein BX600DRAFT_383246 [Xylariales sp. PMI_506]